MEYAALALAPPAFHLPPPHPPVDIVSLEVKWSNYILGSIASRFLALHVSSAVSLVLALKSLWLALGDFPNGVQYAYNIKRHLRPERYGPGVRAMVFHDILSLVLGR